MPFPQMVAFLIGIADFGLGGLISNSFIVTMMIMKWTKYKRLGSSEKFLLSMGLSNICGSISLVTNMAIELSESNLTSSLWFQIIFLFNASVICFRFWLAAWLCVFYCIKIVNSTCAFILWCKQRLSWLVPRFLVGTLVISFISCIAGYTTAMYAGRSNVTGIIINGTQAKSDIFRSFKLFFMIIGNGCPFVIALLCSVVPVASLYRHLRHVTVGESSFQSFQTKAHINAIGTMVSLIFLYISWVLAQILPNAQILNGEMKYSYFFSAPVIIIYSPVQAIILVLSNPKLKYATIRLLQRTQI